MQRLMIWACLGLLGAANGLSAGTLYVNNHIGRPENDGRARESASQYTGPVNSIRAALKLVRNGDTIVLANTGLPYYESFTLTGARLGGIPGIPLTIQGNGATLSGLRSLRPEGWLSHHNGLWELSFNRKGHYRLLREGASLPEYRHEGAGNPLEALPLDHWTGYRGHVFYRTTVTAEPTLDRFEYAAEDVGITLYQVEHVRIENLTVQHFRLDGISAFNDCRHIELENVTCRENGRAGLAAGGASSVVFRRGNLEANGREAALVTGKAVLSIQDSQSDAEPTLRP